MSPTPDPEIGAPETTRPSPSFKLIALQEQLRSISKEPPIQAAYRLTADVKEVLEPVWAVTARTDPGGGVGYLRSLGATGLSPARTAANEAVATTAIDRYEFLDLAAPTMREVWTTLSRPSTALIESIRSAPRDTGQENDSLGATVRPILPSLLLSTWQEENRIVPALRRLLCQWCEIARHACGDRQEAAQLTLAAALLARGAVLDGDTATVRWFVKSWLGLGATDARVDGASAALLDAGWVSRSVDTKFSAIRDTVTDLRIEASYQHRMHRPVWETQLSGANVGLLSELSEAFDVGATVLLGSESDQPLAIVSNTFRDLQLEEVLKTISDRERHVVMGIASGKTQTQLAAELGITRYRIRMIHSKTMSKLRHPSRSNVMRDYLDD